MKIRTPALIIIALFFLTLLTGLVISCGIPSYPYLYPPEAQDPFATVSVLTFTHDDDNDPAVFKGYEIFYRFYATEPNSAGTSQAESDMRKYFTSSYQISSIISKTTTSTADTYGFRRAIVKETPDDTPQLTITPPSEIETSFQVELVQTNDSSAPIELNLSYDDSITYTLFRSATEDSTYKSFYPRNSSYAENDTDIVDEGIDITTADSFYVAFFVVPYGFDISVGELYANGSYEGMEYIGRFEIQ
ncbi:MAG: hypothetical protein K9L66_00960 [Spirochaetaceae bacterium]|nr:hypothetical protein [Spirochaetaceae bacterium]MCF7947290.1 hypothetical protein [Spirochaetia bacterium]MCF7950183.1 hypothetical protein [Spirochaetaceae bacterium]